MAGKVPRHPSDLRGRKVLPSGWWLSGIHGASAVSLSNLRLGRARGAAHGTPPLLLCLQFFPFLLGADITWEVPVGSASRPKEHGKRHPGSSTFHQSFICIQRFSSPSGAPPDPRVTQTPSGAVGCQEVPKVALRWEKISMSCSKLQNFSVNLPLPRIPLDSLMDNSIRYLKCRQNLSWNKSQTSPLINTSGRKTTQTNLSLFQIINHL